METSCAPIWVDADKERNVLDEPARQGRLVTVYTSRNGLGIAQTLACHGADMMMNGFGDADQIEQIRSGVDKGFAVRVPYSDADIGKFREVATMAGQTQDEPGSLDLLVNNAGIRFTAHFKDFPTG